MSTCNTCNTCDTQNSIELDFGPDTLDMVGLRVGHSYQFQIEITDEDGVAIDITADDFEMSILDSSLTEVENLQVGAGLSVTAPNVLLGLISSLTTGTAGRYTHTIVWTIAASGATPLFAQGKINVKA